MAEKSNVTVLSFWRAFKLETSTSNVNKVLTNVKK